MDLIYYNIFQPAEQVQYMACRVTSDISTKEFQLYRIPALRIVDCHGLPWIAMAPGGLHKMSRWASTMEIVVTFVGGSVVQHLVLTTYMFLM